MEEKRKEFITKETIIAGVIGILIGLAAMFLIGWSLNYFAKSAGMAKLKYGSETIATVNGKGIDAQTIWNKTKKIDGLSMLLNEIDREIFKDMYELTEEEEKEIKEQATYYIDYYKSMGYTEEEFLAGNGFNDYEDFVEDIRKSMKTSKYLYDYLEGKLEDGAIEKYYNENKDSIETYDSEHILVKISDTVTDEQALALANEIIGKLNEGKAFSDVVEEYKDQIVHEELGYQGKTANLEQPYIDELVALEDGAYSETPIKTSYGYHIVHKIATSKLEDLRETIIETLSEDLLTEDGNIPTKAIVELRKEKNAEIYDEELKKLYEEYCNELYKTE